MPPPCVWPGWARTVNYSVEPLVPPPGIETAFAQHPHRIGVDCTVDRMSHDGIYYPEDKIPFARLVPMGLQHVVAMFGATVLAPLLMGFNPQTALFFTGVGTLI